MKPPFKRDTAAALRKEQAASRDVNVYIADLGVNVIWLLPFYPSPRLDDG